MSFLFSSHASESAQIEQFYAQLTEDVYLPQQLFELHALRQIQGEESL